MLEIPADRIVGTRTAGRISAFSAGFLPLLDADSEFALKWMALCRAHLSDTGIRDPIECWEYLGDFYVQEGNKRVSVLRWFGAVTIPARVRRVLPRSFDTPRERAYGEFLEFYRASRIYGVQFRKPGEYAKLLFIDRLHIGNVVEVRECLQGLKSCLYPGLIGEPQDLLCHSAVIAVCICVGV